jgi:maltooligosyltrehalose trehalohydrolase
MSLLPLSLLGARVQAASPKVIDFGLYLPGLTSAGGFSITLKIIHEADQFIQTIPPFLIPLGNPNNTAFPNDDYWSLTVDTSAAPPGQAIANGSHWGDPGDYVYRFAVTLPGNLGIIDYVLDPYARQYGVGDLAAVTIGGQDYQWSAQEATWKTPALNDLIAYELMITEFAGDIDKTIALLGYLADLGINCIEVMPVNDVLDTINWGYDPMGYFGVDHLVGDPQDFQRLVDQAHQNGIAVILDVVFGHTTAEFPIYNIYNDPRVTIANPMFDRPARPNFGEAPDFTLPYTQDFFRTVTHYWLDKFHLDGLRYDNANGFDAAGDPGPFAALALSTYQDALAAEAVALAGAPNYWNRFVNGPGALNLIQCPEWVTGTPTVLNNSVANCAWQNQTWSTANDCANAVPGAINTLGASLGLMGYNASATISGVTIDQTAFQYIENHDHARFICNFGVDQSAGDVVFYQGYPQNWYCLQPYLIGMFTAVGIPMLWEGGEFCQLYYVDEQGDQIKKNVFRPVDWTKFYTTVDPAVGVAYGMELLTLVRKLVKIRQAGAQFRASNQFHFFYGDPYYTNQGILLFRRWTPQSDSMVALNFTSQDVYLNIQFTNSGTYRELIDGQQNLPAVVSGAPVNVRVPSNYGQIWANP